jgi:hypothetical protein
MVLFATPSLVIANVCWGCSNAGVLSSENNGEGGVESYCGGHISAIVVSPFETSQAVLISTGTSRVASTLRQYSPGDNYALDSVVSTVEQDCTLKYQQQQGGQ